MASVIRPFRLGALVFWYLVFATLRLVFSALPVMSLHCVVTLGLGRRHGHRLLLVTKKFLVFAICCLADCSPWLLLAVSRSILLALPSSRFLPVSLSWLLLAHYKKCSGLAMLLPLDSAGHKFFGCSWPCARSIASRRCCPWTPLAFLAPLGLVPRSSCFYHPLS